MNYSVSVRTHRCIQVSAGNDYIGERTFHASIEIKCFSVFFVEINSYLLDLFRINDSYESEYVNKQHCIYCNGILDFYSFTSHIKHLELARLHIVHFPLHINVYTVHICIHTVNRWHSNIIFTFDIPSCIQTLE